MWNEGSKFAVRQVHEASIGKGLEPFLDVVGEMHNCVANSHEKVRILIVHGLHSNRHNVWKISNNLSGNEEMEIAVLMHNVVHKEHYAKRNTDLETEVRIEDLVDDDQTINV